MIPIPMLSHYIILPGQDDFVAGLEWMKATQAGRRWGDAQFVVETLIFSGGELWEKPEKTRISSYLSQFSYEFVSINLPRNFWFVNGLHMPQLLYCMTHENTSVAIWTYLLVSMLFGHHSGSYSYPKVWQNLCVPRAHELGQGHLPSIQW